MAKTSAAVPNTARSQTLDESRYGKIKIEVPSKRRIMEFVFFPGETMFLTFKLANGSAWLTSHRLILREHEPGHLEEGKKPEFYHLKNFKKAQITNEALTVHF
jgi:hypothetical protein